MFENKYSLHTIQVQTIIEDSLGCQIPSAGKEKTIYGYLITTSTYNQQHNGIERDFSDAVLFTGEELSTNTVIEGKYKVKDKTALRHGFLYSLLEMV